MKVVVAIDSLKGCMSSMDAGSIIKEGILEVIDANVIVKPLADGGEGTVDALLSGLNGQKIDIEVTGPLGNLINSSYALLNDSKTAVIEIAAAAGIKLIDNADLNPLHTTTFGVGEMILDAISRGCLNFIIGLGGSATNDGGLGMLTALGYEFLDGSGMPVGIFGKDLEHITKISTHQLNHNLQHCQFMIACDVKNPLHGPNGATYIYGPQKGATESMLKHLENNLIHFSEIVHQHFNIHTATYPGSGAAGGLGFAFLSFLKSELASGIDIIIKEISLEDDIRDADFVITGEGKLDYQTSMGKAPIGVAKIAKKHNKKVIAFAGGTTDEARLCNEHGIDAYFSILQLPMTTEAAMSYEVAKNNLKTTTTQVFRLIHTLYKDEA